ncbi:MAG: hypothetical protein PHH04_02095 [Thomasclavelia sp.]|jgi:hypothetical protein|nr:hypothetical protein [Thomasclavelia sp.]
MRKILSMILCFSIVCGLTGCGSKDNSSSTSSSSTSDEPAISIKDIDWKVKEGIIDGDRYALFDYTNNTPYTISNIEIKFKEKSKIKKEDKEKYYSDMQEELDASEEEMEEIKEKEISFTASSDEIVDKNKSIKNQRLYYYSGNHYLSNYEHYKLSEPDTATISFIDNNKIYKVYYDFHSKNYTYDDKTEKAIYWTKTVIKDKVPKPDAKVIKKGGSDDDSLFMFYAYGMNMKKFNKYIDDCKKMGYTVDPSSFDGFYSADNKEGYNVYLSYDEDNHSMNGMISAPDNE